jgi:anti-sigma factor RsiW
MHEPICDRLDDFLLGELGDPDRAAFEVHLGGCAPCRAEVDGQHAIDGLLADAVDAFEACPPALVPEVARGLQSARRRHAAGWGAGVAASCAAVILAGWGFLPDAAVRNLARRHVPPPADRRTATSPERPSNAVVASSPETDDAPVIVQFPDSFIGVPVKSSNPKITIYLVYPVIGSGQQADASDTNDGFEPFPEGSTL